MNEPISILLSYSIYFLNSNFSLWKYEEIKKGEREIFVVLRELCLTKAATATVAAHAAAFATAAAFVARTTHATVAAGSARAARAVCPATAAVSGAAVAAVDDEAADVYDKIYNNAKKEFEETGEIKGYEVYLVSLNKKVWIGKEDWENFYKLNAK